MTAAINDPPSSRAADESRPSTDPGADALADTLADEVLSTGAGDGTKQFVHMGFGRVVRSPSPPFPDLLLLGSI